MSARTNALAALDDANNTTSTTTKALHLQTAQAFATLALAEAIEAAGTKLAAAITAGVAW